MMQMTHRSLVDRYGYIVPTRYGPVPWAGAVATYRPGEGPFGGDAIAVEEATENLVNVDFSSWGRTFVIPEIYADGSVKVSNNNYHISRFRSPMIPVTEGQVVTASIYVKAISPGSDSPRIVFYGDNDEYIPNQSGTIFTGPGRYTLTATIPAGVYSVSLWVRPSVTADEEWVVIERPQVETKHFATSFVDGTRGAGILPVHSVPNDVFMQPFTVSVVGKSSNDDLIGNLALFGRWNSFYVRVGTGSRRFELVWLDSDGATRVTSSATASMQNDWHRYTLVYDGENLIGYIDDLEMVRAENPQIIPPEQVPFGWGTIRGSSTIYPWNGLLADATILPYAATPEQIAGWADGPLPVIPDAVLQWGTGGVRAARSVAL